MSHLLHGSPGLIAAAILAVCACVILCIIWLSMAMKEFSRVASWMSSRMAG
jgi:hypothetical protein